MTDDGISSNSSTNCSNSTSGIPSTSNLYPWYTVAGVIIAVSCLLGVPANIAIIVKLCHRLHGSSISQRLFFSLAVSDLLCLLCLPVAVVIFYNGPHLTHEVCQLLIYFFFFCMTSDLNILVLISIQRYYQILHPKKWDELRRRWQRVILSSVWLLGALVALPVVFSLIDAKTVTEHNDGRSCKNQRITPVLEAVYILFIVFSHLVLLTFYLLLVRGLKNNQMPNKKDSSGRFTKIFIRIIAVSLVVALLPLILRVLYVAALLTESDPLMLISRKLTFVECFYFFSHCLNPFLYFFSSRHQKRESDMRRKTFIDP